MHIYRGWVWSIPNFLSFLSFNGPLLSLSLFFKMTFYTFETKGMKRTPRFIFYLPPDLVFYLLHKLTTLIIDPSCG